LVVVVTPVESWLTATPTTDDLQTASVTKKLSFYTKGSFFVTTNDLPVTLTTVGASVLTVAFSFTA
jgi:hypothetical protein